MRLTVRTMATPSGLRSTCLCGHHAAQAWLIAGGGGLHCELVMLVSYAESLAEVNISNGTMEALHKVQGKLLAIKDSQVTNIFLDVISLNQIVICLELLVGLVKEELVSEHLVQADVHINLIIEECSGVLFHTSNY